MTRSFDTENPRSLSDCRFWDTGHRVDCGGRVGFVVDDHLGENYVECEVHHNQPQPKSADTWPLLLHESGDVKYVGPLNPALRIAEIDNGPLQLDARRDGIGVSNDHGWGFGKDVEEAIRLYLGGVFGPIDENYIATELRYRLNEEIHNPTLVAPVESEGRRVK